MITNTYFYDNIESWTKNLRELNLELENREKEKKYVAGSRAPRILLTGSPSIFPNLIIPLRMFSSSVTSDINIPL